MVTSTGNLKTVNKYIYLIVKEAETNTDNLVNKIYLRN